MKIYKFIPISMLFLLLLVFLPLQIVAGDSEWIRVRSQNFDLLGNALETDVRQVATKLEQFRAALRQILGQYNFNSPVPTTVVVFKSAEDYKFFKPLKQNGETKDIVSGYFQAGKDINYIALSSAGDPSRVFQIIFHEYTHFLIRNNLGESKIPAWYNEGLAVYYETSIIENDQKMIIGIPPAKMLSLLRQNEIIPFDTFFNTDNLSLHEQDEEAVGLFYSQSWALMHYLIHAENGARKPQLDQFLKMLMEGKSARTAFNQAFQTDFPTMERELKKYIERKSFDVATVSLENKISSSVELKASALTAGEVDAQLGDLLFHLDRIPDAQARLEKALQLNPDLALAQSSLGLIKLKQGDVTGAEKLLSKAVESDSANYLVHFYYAYALSRVGMSDFGFITSYDPITAEKMRTSLKKSISLNPNFAESYDLYAFVSLIRNERLDEAIVYVEKALNIAPGNQWYLIHLAQLYSNKEDFHKAKSIAVKVVSTAGDKELKVYSQNALQRIISLEAAYENIRNNRNRPDESIINRILTEEELAELRARYMTESLNESLYKPKFGEKRILANLTQIDCQPREMIYSVKSKDEPGRILKFRSASFDTVRFVAFTSDMAFSNLACGTQKKETLAVINYRPMANSKSSILGEIVSVEFVPQNFKFVN